MLPELKDCLQFANNTTHADKIYKTIGYGSGSLGHVLSHFRADPDIVDGLKKLSSAISLARYVTRVTGTFQSYDAFRCVSWALDDDDSLNRLIAKAQAFTMMLYYPLEHVSYIGFMAPKLIRIDAGKISRQSCIAWLMYIILDMYANQRRIRKLALEECSILEGSDDTDRKKKLPEIRTRKSELHYTQLRNACLLPTCLHWSIHEGVLPESVVQYLCCLEACVGLWRAWTNSTRQSERAQRS